MLCPARLPTPTMRCAGTARAAAPGGRGGCAAGAAGRRLPRGGHGEGRVRLPPCRLRAPDQRLCKPPLGLAPICPGRSSHPGGGLAGCAPAINTAWPCSLCWSHPHSMAPQAALLPHAVPPAPPPRAPYAGGGGGRQVPARQPVPLPPRQVPVALDGGARRVAGGGGGGWRGLAGCRGMAWGWAGAVLFSPCAVLRGRQGAAVCLYLVCAFFQQHFLAEFAKKNAAGKWWEMVVVWVL